MDCSKTPERRPRPWRLAIGLAAAGVLFSATAYAQPVFAKIADTSDLVPITTASDPTLGRYFGPPVLSRSGLDAVFGHAYYRGVPTGGFVGRFASSDYSLLTDHQVYDYGQGIMVFKAPIFADLSFDGALAVRTADIVDQQKLGGIRVVLGAHLDRYVTVAQQGDFVGTYEMDKFTPPSIARTAGLQVAFVAQDPDFNDALIVADVTYDSQTPHLIYQDGDDPNETGELLDIHFSQAPSLNRSSSLAFFGSLGGRQGIYIARPGSPLETAVDDTMSIPGRPGYTFALFGSPALDKSGGDRLTAWFLATNGPDVLEGILAWVDGELSLVADTLTPTDFGPLFSAFGHEPSISGQLIAFTGGYGPPNPSTNALFVTDVCSGIPEMVVGQGDVVSGRVVREVAIQREGLSGRDIGMHLTFENEHPSNEPQAGKDEGVFEAYLPEEVKLEVGPLEVMVDAIAEVDGGATAEVTAKLETCDGGDRITATVTTPFPGTLEAAWMPVAHELMMPLSEVGAGDVLLDQFETTVVVNSAKRCTNAAVRQAVADDLAVLVGASSRVASSAQASSGSTGTSPLAGVFDKVEEASGIGAPPPAIGIQITDVTVIRGIIELTVRDGNGDPMPGVEVVATYCWGDPMLCGQTEATTDADGYTFLQTGHPDGPWTITATAPNGETTTLHLE